MTSDNNDLEAALQENLKLRSELAANAAKPETTSQRGGIGYRLGWALYWLCLIAVGLWFAVWAIWMAFSQPSFGELPMSEWPLSAWAAAAAFVAVPALVIYGLGRAVRYVLSGE